MTDPIENAIIKTQGALITANKIDNTYNTINSLPIDDDPELIKKQIEGEIFKVKSFGEQISLSVQERAIEELKIKMSEISIPVGPLEIRLPPIDIKSLKTLDMHEQAKKLMQEKQDLSTQTLQDAKNIYTYPLNRNKGGVETN